MKYQNLLFKSLSQFSDKKILSGHLCVFSGLFLSCILNAYRLKFYSFMNFICFLEMAVC